MIKHIRKIILNFEKIQIMNIGVHCQLNPPSKESIRNSRNMLKHLKKSKDASKTFKPPIE